MFANPVGESGTFCKVALALGRKLDKSPPLAYTEIYRYGMIIVRLARMRDETYHRIAASLPLGITAAAVLRRKPSRIRRFVTFGFVGLFSFCPHVQTRYGRSAGRGWMRAGKR